MALALRKDLSVRNIVPFDSVLSRRSFCVSGTRTDLTISVEIAPSSRTSFCGRVEPGCTLMEKSISRALLR